MSGYAINFVLPDWLPGYVEAAKKTYNSVEDRMALVIDAATRNVDCDLGGPFGAGIFERDSGRIISIGVNRVMHQNCSVLHAEIMAIMLAQRNLGTYTLAGDDSRQFELFTTCEPCGMCLGAVVWSGARRLVCGARESDAFDAGFDEGPKPQNWIEKLQKRGIDVEMDVGREQARRIFHHYVQKGGIIYNP